MHLDDLVKRRDFTGANRPDGFIRDDGILACAAVGQGACKLFGDDIQGGARAAIRLAFADADDGRQPRVPSGLRLGRDISIRFAIGIAALGMAEDHIGRADLLDHRGRDIASEGTFRLCVAILRADANGGALGFGDRW